MKDWFEGWGGRQRIGAVCLGVGVLLMAVSVALVFAVYEYDRAMSGEPMELRTTGLMKEAFEALRDVGGLLNVRGLAQFVQGPVALAGFVGSYAVALPSVFLFWLAGRSRLFAWLCRVAWSLLFLAGPVVFAVFLAGEGGVILSEGFTVWAVGCGLIAAGFWITAPMKGEREPEGPGAAQQSGVKEPLL